MLLMAKELIEILKENKVKDRNNELHQYCKLMHYLCEVGMFYQEAKEYAKLFVKKRLR